jgi:GNAT superfamily N-acetyltransferase
MPSPSNHGLGATRNILPLDRSGLPAVVRSLRRADLPAVVELRRRIWPDRIETPGSVAWALDHPDPAEHMRRWVATVDRVVVGSAAASRATWTPDPVAYVYVGVDRPWRGRGIGGRLFDLGAAHAAALGISRVLVATDRGDEVSARFVVARGFRRTREIRTWSLDPASAPLRELP